MLKKEQLWLEAHWYLALKASARQQHTGMASLFRRGVPPKGRRLTPGCAASARRSVCRFGANRDASVDTGWSEAQKHPLLILLCSVCEWYEHSLGCQQPISDLKSMRSSRAQPQNPSAMLQNVDVRTFSSSSPMAPGFCAAAASTSGLWALDAKDRIREGGVTFAISP